MEIVAISIGAVLGANARYLLGGWVADRLGAGFPFGTLLINLSGSFLLGLILAMISDRAVAPTWVRAGLAVGLIGSYTTFSTFSAETLGLITSGNLLSAGLNMVASVGGTLIAVYLGMQAGQLI